MNEIKYSVMDLIDMINKMKKEGRITELEIKMISGLVARYVFLQDKYEGENG